MTTPPPVLQALEDQLVEMLRPLVVPAGPLREIVVEPVSSADDLKAALERMAERVPVGILSMAGNATFPQEPKPAGLAAQIDALESFTFMAAFSDYGSREVRKASIYNAHDLFVLAMSDRAFTGLPVAQGWLADRVEMVSSAVVVTEKVYGIVWSFQIRLRAKVHPQTAEVT